MAGSPIRTDIVEVYVFRRISGGSESNEFELLQLRRCGDRPLGSTWQPVLGHSHDGETAVRAAMRELNEETGFALDNQLISLWQLEQPNIYFLHREECLVASPCFAAEVKSGEEPILDLEHDASRWIAQSESQNAFIWPGQRQAVQQIARDIINPSSPVEAILRITRKSL